MARIAYVVDVARADALLNVGQARAHRVLRAQQVGNQRMHAGGGEQNRGVVLRNDGGGRNHGVSLALEEFQIHAAKVGRALDVLVHGENFLSALLMSKNKRAQSIHKDEMALFRGTTLVDRAPGAALLNAG